MKPESLIAIATLAVALIASVTDIRHRRIPNVLTFSAAALGLVFHGVVGGASELMTAAVGLLVGFGLFFPFFALGGMGGGDVKLLAALGAWLGPRDAMWLAIYTSLAGGVMAIVIGLSQGYLSTALRNVRTIVVSWCLTGPKPVPSMTLADSKAPRLAYAIPILVGTMVVVWLR